MINAIFVIVLVVIVFVVVFFVIVFVFVVLIFCIFVVFLVVVIIVVVLDVVVSVLCLKLSWDSIILYKVGTGGPVAFCLSHKDGQQSFHIS